MEITGSYFKKYRLRKEWTQQHAATQIGLSVAAYNKLERNITVLTLPRFYELVELYQLDLEIVNIRFPEKHCPTYTDQILSLKQGNITKAEEIVRLNSIIAGLRKELEEQYGQLHPG